MSKLQRRYSVTEDQELVQELSGIWLNEKGVDNLLSMTILEEAGYKVSTHTARDFEATIPKEEVILFTRNTGICKGMPYIDLHE